MPAVVVTYVPTEAEVLAVLRRGDKSLSTTAVFTALGRELHKPIDWRGLKKVLYNMEERGSVKIMAKYYLPKTGSST